MPYRGKALRLQTPWPVVIGWRIRCDLSDHPERLAPAGPAGSPGPVAPSRAREARTATRPAISAWVGWPRTTGITGTSPGPTCPIGLTPGVSLDMGMDLALITKLSALRLADSDAELPVHTCPECISEPLPRFLVGAQREAEFLLGVDEELLVDHRGQDRP